MRKLRLSFALLLVIGACGGTDLPDQPDAEPTPDVDVIEYDAPPPPDAMVDAIPSIELVCDDDLDNDLDGQIDCLDSDCVGGPECIPETICNDDIDNEGDGDTDCADEDCNGMNSCQFGTERACGDTFDNDADGNTDCQDMDCDGISDCEFAGEATCDDTIDNDEDGTIDCLDSDCNGVAGCEFGSETTCNDGFDNDADGAADCSDLGCDGIDGCEITAEVTCGDGLDNDADGVTDCADSDCATVSPCEFPAELTCDDGLDNDGDGLTDCLDPACDAVGTCEYGLEATCDDGIDNDGDGATDCPDTNCANTALCLTNCLPGMTVTTIAATDLPLPILDGTAPPAISNVVYAGGGIVFSAAVKVDITHTYDADVDITLQTPSGTILDVSTDNGSSGDNYTQTYFSDLGAGVIGTTAYNTAPFTGVYRPEQAFSTLGGNLPDGTWSLIADDDLAAFSGTLNQYTLYLCTCNGQAGCEQGEACRDGLSNDDDADIDCADTDCVGQPNCLPEPNCTNGVDDDFDGSPDCADSDCAGIGTCEFGIELSCADTLDNDGDTNPDCADSDCDGIGTCEFGTELTCGDGLDNDADGGADCDDTDCDIVFACMVEADCADGIDNDLDGVADCLDVGCDGVAGCEFGAEASCNDGFDNDGDGSSDCLDTNCATTALCSITLSCPAGAVKYGFTATDTPLPVPDGSGPAVTSNISVTAAGVFLNGAVRINIPHTWDSDLNLALIPPVGAARDLSIANGGSGDNYTNTVFSDAGAGVIGSTGYNTAPFTGTYRPEGPAFSGLIGTSITGTWGLRADDTVGSDVGTINEYSLVLCACDPAGGECEFGALCGDGIDNDADGATDCLDTNCAADVRCIPEPNCTNGLDDDLDTFIDCGDSDCNTVGFCEFGAEFSCADGNDNDRDGTTDCFDSNCVGTPECAAELNCTDGLDNDADTFIDCGDVDCDGVGFCTFGIEVDCADVHDNDRDGATDCFDTDCVGTPVCLLPETACTDGFDNDADTFIDCADPDCFGAAGCEVEPNNTALTANDFDAIAVNHMVRGAISPAADNDYFMVVVPPGSNAIIYAENFSNNAGTACTGINTTINIYSSDGVTSVASDLDSGILSCARISYNAAPGTYYVRTIASTTTATFTYTLRVLVTPIPAVPATETEPNDDGTLSTAPDYADFSAAAANGPFTADSYISAAITPIGDEDGYAITNTGATDQVVVFETYGAAGAGTCVGDTYLFIRDAAGVSLAFNDDDGIGACSALNYTIPAGATVYAHLADFSDDGVIAGYYLWVNFL